MGGRKADRVDLDHKVLDQRAPMRRGRNSEMPSFRSRLRKRLRKTRKVKRPKSREKKMQTTTMRMKRSNQPGAKLWLSQRRMTSKRQIPKPRTQKHRRQQLQSQKVRRT